MNVVHHPFEPVCGDDPRLLILGTMPSVASREDGFYYGHPRNRFWQVLAAVFEEPVAADRAEKKSLLIRNGIALWDVLSSCEIEGSADSSIRRPVPNDVEGFMRRYGIAAVFANGGTAGRLAKRYGVEAFVLPSTSPANAHARLAGLIEAWSVIRTNNPAY